VVFLEKVEEEVALEMEVYGTLAVEVEEVEVA
jgi:hypothetical protein